MCGVCFDAWAFSPAPFLARRLNALTGPKTAVAHPLGNVLVSSAITAHGPTCARYCMLNAAVASEAYDEGARSAGMVDPEWVNVPPRFRATGWHALFDGEAFAGDLRRTLAWRGRFAGIPNAVNFYSASEDVVGNVLSGSVVAAQSVWVAQERLKGTVAMWALDVVPGSSIVCEGGWGVNARYAVDSCWYVSGPGFKTNMVHGMSDVQAITNSLFTPFGIEEEGMHGTAVFTGAGSAHGDLSHRDWLRARFLADAIPAESGAVGANALGVSGITDVQLDADCIANADKWPKRRMEIPSGNTPTSRTWPISSCMGCLTGLSGRIRTRKETGCEYENWKRCSRCFGVVVHVPVQRGSGKGRSIRRGRQDGRATEECPRPWWI